MQMDTSTPRLAASASAAATIVLRAARFNVFFTGNSAAMEEGLSDMRINIITRGRRQRQTYRSLSMK